MPTGEPGPRQKEWAKFEELGEEKVRQNIAAHVYGGSHLKSAHQWLEWRESSSSADSRAESLALARAANEEARSANVEARSANELARQAAKAARISNIIATLALIAAVIAIAVSVIHIR